MWYYNKAPLAYPLKELRKIQRRAALYVFHTSFSLGIETIAELIPIHLHLQKLSRHQQLRTHSLSNNHIIKFFLENRHNELSRNHHLLLENLTPI